MGPVQQSVRALRMSTDRYTYIRKFVLVTVTKFSKAESLDRLFLASWQKDGFDETDNSGQRFSSP